VLHGAAIRRLLKNKKLSAHINCEQQYAQGERDGSHGTGEQRLVGDRLEETPGRSWKQVKERGYFEIALDGDKITPR